MTGVAEAGDKLYFEILNGPFEQETDPAIPFEARDRTHNGCKVRRQMWCPSQGRGDTMRYHVGREAYLIEVEVIHDPAKLG